MEKIGIITDEAADLPKDIIGKHQIAIVPVKLDWPEIENLPGENTFQKMREAEKKGIKGFGKTSQPSPKDFLDKYKYQLERFDKILCITLTSKLSGTYNSAIQAKNFLEPDYNPPTSSSHPDKSGRAPKQGKVFIIDSLSASSGQALLVLKAIDLIAAQEGEPRSPRFAGEAGHEGRESGKGIEEITQDLEKFVPRVQTFVVFEDPKWIEASGRIPHLLANVIRSLMKSEIRPVLTFKKGKLVLAGFKAHAKDVPTTLFQQFEKTTEKTRKQRKRIRTVITHGDNLAGAQRLKEMVEKEFENTEVAFINIINNVVGAPAGPNALTLAWCEI